MDCCSKYPTDYTRPCHHTIPPSVGAISANCSSNSIMSNTNLYGPRLVHPSLRYQSTLNRNGFPPPIGYDGFGPPPLPPTPTLGNSLPPHPYQNYDLRYDPNSRSYSNYISSNGSTPLYPYSNSNGFSYGHLNSRFYNHHYHHSQHQQQQQQQQQQLPQQHYYDSYGRIIAANHPYSYQHNHNYHTIRNSGNPSTLNGTNSAYHHVYGHRQNSPYHPLRGLDYHTPPTQYYSPHHSHHHHHQNNNSLQHFNSNLYPSHTLTTPHNNDILQQNYSGQQSDQSVQNNLIKDSIFLPHITNTSSSEQDERNRYSVNGLNRKTEDIDCDGIIEINSNSDKEISARCNSTQSIVNSPSENSTTINTNNDSGTIYNSELTVPSSPLTNGSADSGISGCGNIGDSLYQNNSKTCIENYDNDNNIGQLENDENEGEENCENKQNIEQKESTNEKEHQDIQSSDVDSTDLKETKSELKNNVKESEKEINRISDSNKRKLDCSTPLINTSPILERSSTPFVHQQQYQHQQQQSHNNNTNYQSRYLNISPAIGQNNNNYSSYYENYYPQSNRTNWSPYSSPHYNYPYSNYSPISSTLKSSATSSIRNKRTFSQISNNRRRKTLQSQQQQRKKPISKSTSSLLTTINKNRVLECDFIPSKKSKKHNKSESEDSFEFREEIKDIKPLPGFQQAFGSTEIGRFSEIFLNTPESPYDNLPYESEIDTSMSPYPWETGDSLEGPHFNLHIGAASLKSCYTDHLNSIINDSSLLENNNYFSGIRCSEY